jgi:hypothetical protein
MVAEVCGIGCYVHPYDPGHQIKRSGPRIECHGKGAEHRRYVAWGDVLMRQGSSKEALLKYAKALKDAPNSRQLRRRATRRRG